MSASAASCRLILAEILQNKPLQAIFRMTVIHHLSQFFDIMVQRFLIDQSAAGEEKQKQDLKKLRQMVDYCHTLAVKTIAPGPSGFLVIALHIFRNLRV
jgi:hypothetical protein